MNAHAERRLRLEAVLETAGYRAALVTARSSVRYLSGFTGSSGVLWIPIDGAPTLITDFRYEEQARQEVGDPMSVHIALDGWIPGLATIVGETVGAAAFEADHLTVAEYERLAESLHGTALKSTRDLVGLLRRVKDDGEVGSIERAVAVAESALQRTLKAIDWTARPTEREVAARLETELRDGGSEKLPFESIVAAGPRTALPHATPSDRNVEPGDLLLIDFGARVNGYCSDITRTFVLGRPEPWQVEMHEQVLEAHGLACQAIAAGTRCRVVDAAARDSLARHGVDRHFGHSTGHGIGLDVHEGPSVSSRSEDTLTIGNVVTVEPGVYLPGRGGVRIEDDVLIDVAGARTLTSLPRALVEL